MSTVLNIYLEHKIADLQAVIQPKFIAIDAIVAGQKMVLTPTPFHMGAIVRSRLKKVQFCRKGLKKAYSPGQIQERPRILKRKVSNEYARQISDGSDRGAMADPFPAAAAAKSAGR